jgi:hypothetical protein
MNKKYFRFISLMFFFLGTIFLLYAGINITGAIIGLSTNPPKFNITLGFTFMVMSLMTSVSGRKSIGKLEKRLVNICAVALLAGYTALLGHAHFAPRQTTATIENVTSSEYQGRKVNIVETDKGRYRNEDSFLYGKHNSDTLQKTAKTLIGRKVDIRNYGYSRNLEFTEYPVRNILDIKEN